MEEGCPIHSSNGNSEKANSKYLLGGDADSCPVPHNSENGKSLSFINGANDELTGKYNYLANDEVFGQERQANQQSNLSTTRIVSSIPKGDINPHHQISNLDKWVYPSQQQYYNAMKRKGYNPAEKDIPIALYIHNSVNEEGWKRVKEWETLRANFNPVLKKFMGRPKDLSPKARLLGLLGYELPFDRHDWIVERDGKEIRYIIDFYQGKPSLKSPISLYMDVRPALDSFSAVADIVGYNYRKYLRPWAFPLQGIKKSRHNSLEKK